MSAFDKLIDAVKTALGKNTRSNRDIRNVRPASEDPYGDPADEARFGGRSVKPASMDPYGDPADEPRRR